MIKTANEIMEKELNKAINDNVINADETSEDIDYDATCPVCGEKLYLNFDFLGKTIRPKVSCKCERDKLAKEKEAKELYNHQKRVKELKYDCFQFKSRHECTFENDNGLNPKMKIAKEYVEKWDTLEKDQAGLLLIGNVGRGKTYMAAAIANALIERELSVKMTDFFSIESEIYGAKDKNAVVNKYISYDLLIIDDFGTERNSDYVQEIIFKIIDERVNSAKPMIVTTNLNIDRINTDNNLTRKRIYDRICSVCLSVDVDGPNIRELITEQNIENTSKTLTENLTD